MLEGVVAGLINRWLGKYVTDLDTENLNVGIFSGQVLLTDLILKPEALYELNLPIVVKIGTIGKVRLQIPWSTLWSQPMIVHVEDVYIVTEPIMSWAGYDIEKDRNLTRAFKKKLLNDLESCSQFVIGGPTFFSEYLVTTLVNNLQVTVQNVHVRYEDSISCLTPISVGLCINNVNAETTNSKWKSSRATRKSGTGYYLIKIEGLWVYWNMNSVPVDVSQYYAWRNNMTQSLQSFTLEKEHFSFVINPMAIKIKLIISKLQAEQENFNLSADVSLQDCNFQLTKEQYRSVNDLCESISRMRINRSHLHLRPRTSVLKDIKAWWLYAYGALVEQRIRPYTWAKIKSVRNHFRLYRDNYKKLLVNPNNTELKMDQQKHEDNLSLVNIVIARQVAKMMVQNEQPLVQIQPISSLERNTNLWCMLLSPEREQLCEMIGYLQPEKDAKTGPCTTEYKCKLNVGNFSLSLFNKSHEVLVLTLTQLVVSSETTEDDWRKYCFSVQSLAVEGASIEDHLVPLLCAEQFNNNVNFFNADFIKNGNGSADLNVDYGLFLNLEALRIVYHVHAITEILKFFDTSCCNFYASSFKNMKTDFNEALQHLHAHNWDIHLNIKLPYLILPEHGSMYKSGNLTIVDFGQVIIQTEVAETPDDSSQSKGLEQEDFYSNYIVETSGTQLLFCDGGDNWKDACNENDTEQHVIAKISSQSTLHTSKTSNKLIPKLKLNTTVQNLKLNISESKISAMIHFIDNLLEASPARWHAENDPSPKDTKKRWTNDVIGDHNNMHYLNQVKKVVVNATDYDVYMSKKLSALNNNVILNQNERSGTASQSSEDMSELWARCVDLPGLEDNVSPHNNINKLFQFNLVEISILLCRSCDRIDRPYLMLRFGKVSLDLAQMDYGPAMQFNIGSICLTDKLHNSSSGQYLDLIFTPMPCEQSFVSILYRKVRANCPDFRTHFHSVETSLVADIGPIFLIIHRDALRTLINYLNYLLEKHNAKLTQYFMYIKSVCFNRSNELDPPIPQGAVKFSHSARLAELNMRLCDSNYDILNMHMKSLECDLVFRANERLLLRLFLRSFNIEHLADVTLYSKVFYTNEDKVFELIYVRNIPKVYSNDCTVNITGNSTSDGSFKLYLGHLQITLLYKLLLQFKNFMSPLADTKMKRLVSSTVRNTFNVGFKFIKGDLKKLHLSVHFYGATFLLPQKTVSPNLIVFHTGEFHLENFFKESVDKQITENILLNLKGLTVSRAVMTLASSLEMQEVMVEPLNFRCDIKRCVKTSTNPSSVRPLSWDVSGALDAVQVTLGQRDLSTLLAIYTDNINEGHFVEFSPDSNNDDSDLAVQLNSDSDVSVESLKAFFSQSEQRQRDVSVKFVFEGASISLFSDCEELLSSPVRDLGNGLVKFSVGELTVSYENFTDDSSYAKLMVQNIAVEDIRSDSDNKIVLQSQDANTPSCGVCITIPPFVDVTMERTVKGDVFINIILEKVAVQLSTLFIMDTIQFVLDCAPVESFNEEGIINHGYEHDTRLTQKRFSALKTTKTLIVAFRMYKPEITFMTNPKSDNTHFLFSTNEIMCDYSRYNTQTNLVMSLLGCCLLHNVSKDNSKPYVVLHPCDLELSKSFKLDEGIMIKLTVLCIRVHVCSSVVHAIKLTCDEVAAYFETVENRPKQPLQYPANAGAANEPPENAEEVDMWTPKKLWTVNVKDRDNRETVTTSKLVTKTFIATLPNVLIICELEGIDCITPLLIFKLSSETVAHSLQEGTELDSRISLQANYYNETNDNWEPLIEPVNEDNEFKAWDVCIKMFRDKAFPMKLLNDSQESRYIIKTRRKIRCDLESDDEDSKSDDDMMFLKPSNYENVEHSEWQFNSLSTCLADSDTEDEDGTIEKIASSIFDIFTKNWSDSDHDDSSETDEETEDSEGMDKDGSDDAALFKKRCNYFLIDAKDTLNITLTFPMLQLLNNLLLAYTSENGTFVKNSHKSLTLINDIGPNSTLELLQKDGQNPLSALKVVCSKNYEKQDSLPSSPVRKVDYDSNDDVFNYSPEEPHQPDLVGQGNKDILLSLLFPTEPVDNKYNKTKKEYLKINVPGFETLYTSYLKRSCTRLLKLKPESEKFKNQTFCLIAEKNVECLRKTLIVRSPLQMCNETHHAINLFYQPSILQQFDLELVGDITNPFETTMRLTVLEPDAIYNVPLYIAYFCKLFIQPAYVDEYHVSEGGLWWKDLCSDLDAAHDIHCKPKEESKKEVFSLRVLLEEESHCKNLSFSVPNYTIRLVPPLLLHNYLPYTLEITVLSLNHTVRVQPGEKTSLYTLDLLVAHKLQIVLAKSGRRYVGNLNLMVDLDDKLISTQSEADAEEKDVKLLKFNAKVDRTDSCNLIFYAPYWIVNKTNLSMQIQGSSSNTIYESSSQEPILFTFKRFTKKTVHVKILESSWSSQFSLDTIGTPGLIVCKDRERKRKYTVIVTTSLSKLCPNLTKIVIMMPHFLVTNNTTKKLRYMEENDKTDLWFDIKPNQCIPFWPETSSMRMNVKYYYGKFVSQSFPIDIAHQTVLRMDKGGAITVEVYGGKSEPFCIVFKKYMVGDAPIQLDNFCEDLFIKVQQNSLGQVTLLSPYNTLLYTWDDPTNKRTIEWNVYNNKKPGFPIDITQDGFGKEYVCFYIIRQGNGNSASADAPSSSESDSSDNEMHNRGTRKDKVCVYWISYMNGLQRTLMFTQNQQLAMKYREKMLQEKVEWELFLSMSKITVSIFTPLDFKELVHVSLCDNPATWEVCVADKWKSLTLELSAWIENKYRTHGNQFFIKDYVHIDFDQMLMLKPLLGKLRRSYEPALWYVTRKSENFHYHQLKIHSIQIDNKLNGDVVFCPIYSRNAKSFGNCFDVAVFKQCNPKYEKTVYKDVQVNVCDFYLSIEENFINRLNQILEFLVTPKDTSVKLQEDIINMHTSLLHIATQCIDQSKKIKIENMYLSPLTLQLGLILKNDTYSLTKCSLRNDVLDYMFNSIKQCHIEVKQLLIKVNSLQIENHLVNFEEFVSTIWEHYCSQILQKFQLQALGLHVLANPYNVKAFSDNTDSSNWEQVANALSIGAKYSLKHIYSPHLNSVLEQDVLELFSQYSMQVLRKSTKWETYKSSIPDYVALASLTFAMGVPIVLNGLIAKHKAGSLLDSKGLFGNALQTLMTKESHGATNCVHMAADILRRMIVLGEPIKMQQRLPRYCDFYFGLKPYSTYEAMGQHLLGLLCNGRFIDDFYWAHVVVNCNGANLILISTLQHVLLVKKTRLWGPWDLEWAVKLDDLTESPQIIAGELVFKVKLEDDRILNNSDILYVAGDKKILSWMKSKIKQAIVLNREEIRTSWTHIDQ